MQPRAEEEPGAASRPQEPEKALPLAMPGLMAWPRRLALALIRFYQNAISPRTPPTCFFYPTCSHYTYQAIERFGFWRGTWLGFCRVCRCHPFARGGYDPLPEEFTWFPSRRLRESHEDLDE